MLTKKKLRSNFAEWVRRVRFVPGLAFALALAFVSGCTPAGPRALLEGRQLIEQGKYIPAIEKLRLATTLLPTNALAWNYLGLAYHYAGESANALGAYQRAIKLNHELVAVHYDLGCLFLEQNKPNLNESARDELIAFTLHQGNSLDGRLKLATAQLRAGELAAAEASFREALRISPQNAEAMNGVGLVQVKRNHPRDGIAWFEAALKQQPDYPPALLNLAVVLQATASSRALALQKYQQYLALSPRPANWDAVNAAEHQLDEELNPPAPVRTPTNVLASSQQTSAPRIPTNTPGRAPVAVANSPKTNAPHFIAAQPPAVNAKTAGPVVLASNSSVPVKQVPAAERIAAPEVVQLSERPTAKVADDSAIPLATQTKQPAPPPASADTATPPEADPLVSYGTKPPRKGFFERMNPANLFRRGSQTGTSGNAALPTDITIPSDNPPPGTPATTVARTVSSAVRDERMSMTNRYAYRSPQKPPAGDRVAAQRLFGQALEAQRDHRVQDAVSEYRAAIQTDPSFFEAQCNLGLSAYDANDMPLSLSSYETALAIRPDSFNARFNFALALRKAGYIIDSAQELERLLVTNANEAPTHLATAHLTLANLYAEQFHQPRAARPHYLKVLDLDPNTTQATTIRFWLRENP